LCKSVEEYFTEGMDAVSGVNGEEGSAEAVKKKKKSQDARRRAGPDGKWCK
jgi:hypothetical protein